MNISVDMKCEDFCIASQCPRRSIYNKRENIHQVEAISQSGNISQSLLRITPVLVHGCLSGVWPQG